MGAIHFNELKVTEDGKDLIIDISVRSEAYHANAYISRVKIQDSTKFGTTSYNFNTAYSADYDPILGVYSYKRHLRLVLTAADLGKANLKDMFFVMVETTNTFTPVSGITEIPCGVDESTTTATVVDLYPIYLSGMQYIKELKNTCSVPSGLTDFILRLKGLELAVKTGNYTTAIDYYKNFFSGVETVRGGGCGCGT